MSLNPVESSLSGEHATMLPVWITRFTVLDSSHAPRPELPPPCSCTARVSCAGQAQNKRTQEFSSSKEHRVIRARCSHLGARGVVLQRRGDEEDELAPGDGRRERGGVVEVGLEQHQTPVLRRAGDQSPEQSRFLLVPWNRTLKSVTQIRHYAKAEHIS